MNGMAVASVSTDNVKTHLFGLCIWYLATAALVSMHALKARRPVLKSRWQRRDTDVINPGRILRGGKWDVLNKQHDMRAAASWLLPDDDVIWMPPLAQRLKC